jgi:hypothetical protein
MTRGARLVVPFTDVHEKTREAVESVSEALAIDLVYFDCSRSDEAYDAVIALLWKTPAETVIVEHDMVPTVKAVAELLDCREEWCAQPYPHIDARRTDGMCWSLGVVRFRASLMERYYDVPAGMAARAARDDSYANRPHWRTVDWRLEQTLESGGVDRHNHQRVCGHMHRDFVRPPDSWVYDGTTLDGLAATWRCDVADILAMNRERLNLAMRARGFPGWEPGMDLPLGVDLRKPAGRSAVRV